MKITSVSIHRTERENSSMLAIANVVIDDSFIIRDIRIIKGEENLFVAMPSKKLADGSFKDIAHPLNSETRTQFTEAVIAEYNKVLAEKEAEPETEPEVKSEPESETETEEE